MKVKESTKNHLETARLLVEGCKESLSKMEESGNIYFMPRQDSITSIKRRCIQARQELLQVCQELDK